MSDQIEFSSQVESTPAQGHSPLAGRVRREATIMNKKNKSKVSYRSMSILAIIVGGFSIIFQFVPDWEFFTFFLSVPVLGGLIGGSSGYEEQDRQQLRQSYKTAYEWLLLVIMAAYAFIELSKWLAPTNGALYFLNSHWCGLMFAAMCALMGFAGLQGRSSASSA